MPAAEVDVDEALVRSLLAEQHPDLLGLDLQPLANGWDNVLFRLGDDLVVRLPRRQLAVPLVEHEQRWLPELAPRLPLPIPAPVRTGRPGAGYPWPWSVVPWFPGASALDAPPHDLAVAAEQLGAFLRALHEPAPAAAPPNPYRGIPLADRDERTLVALDALAGDVEADEVRAVWSELRDAPAWDGPPVWVHGDVHPGNLVVDRGELAAVIDFGDLTAGDPACDLAVAWMLLPPEHRPPFRAAAGAADDDHLWTRARGWALALGVVTLASSRDNPRYERHARRTIANVLTDPHP
jgi:aminoglycoside phosphotransferase (APT) family kinase protein